LSQEAKLEEKLKETQEELEVKQSLSQKQVVTIALKNQEIMRIEAEMKRKEMQNMNLEQELQSLKDKVKSIEILENSLKQELNNTKVTAEQV